MSGFGDYVDDDAYDPSPPDPEQVTIKLHKVRRSYSFEAQEWEQLTDHQREVRIAIVTALLDWLRLSGSLP